MGIKGIIFLPSVLGGLVVALFYLGSLHVRCTPVCSEADF